MAAQDDARENQLVDLFNLERGENRVRHGTDAILTIDGRTLEFELKSVTTVGGGLSTVRDLGRDHISKWRDKHWIIAFYDKSGKLGGCRYASPHDMEPWISKIWEYIEPEFRVSDVVHATVSLDEMQSIVGAKNAYSIADAKKLHKNQLTTREYAELCDVEAGYSPERMLDIFRRRVGYLLQRGSTLNNPHIPFAYFDHHEPIVKDHAATLRTLVREWLGQHAGEISKPS